MNSALRNFARVMVPKGVSAVPANTQPPSCSGIPSWGVFIFFHSPRPLCLVRRRLLTGCSPAACLQARSIGVLRTPTEGSWAYVAKRREAAVGKKTQLGQKIKFQVKSNTRAAAEPEPVWSEVAHLRQHHAQTKL